MRILHETKKKLRQNPAAWRYVLNWRQSVGYTFAKPVLSAECQRILRDVNENGIAMTSCEALLSDQSLYDELRSEIDVLEKEFAPKIDVARARAGDAAAIGEKTFLFFLLGEKPQIDSESVFTRFALQKELLGVANAYLGLWSQLRYYNVWHTLANTGPARESQLWHRDRDDCLTLKVFLYLNDVGEGAGPFTYAKQTHPKGRNRSEPEFSLEGTVKRSTDAQMSGAAPRDTWCKAVGRRGTVIFADTRGYHKGGEARTDDRIMYTCMFLSPAAEVREMMGAPNRVRLPQDRAAALALSRYVGA